MDIITAQINETNEEIDSITEDQTGESKKLSDDEWLKVQKLDYENLVRHKLLQEMESNANSSLEIIKALVLLVLGLVTLLISQNIYLFLN